MGQCNSLSKASFLDILYAPLREKGSNTIPWPLEFCLYGNSMIFLFLQFPNTIYLMPVVLLTMGQHLHCAAHEYCFPMTQKWLLCFIDDNHKGKYYAEYKGKYKQLFFWSY